MRWAPGNLNEPRIDAEIVDGLLPNLDTLDSRQFLIAVKRLATSLSHGTDVSPYVGAGIEYAQSRPYEYGDPIRRIDWKLTARTGRVYVKEYETPKRLPCYLLLDTSASMTIGSQPPSKYALAVHIAGGIALACLDRVSPVGLLGVGGRRIRVEPSLSRQQIHRWLHAVRRFRYDEPTHLAARIAETSGSLTERGLVIVFSDLHQTGVLPALKQLAQRHDVAVLQFRDPAESGLRGGGLLRAREAETGREFVTHGRRQWLDHGEVADQLKRSGIDHLVVDNDRPFVHAVRRFFQSRDLIHRVTR